jgi:hypothetical protein
MKKFRRIKKDKEETSRTPGLRFILRDDGVGRVSFLKVRSFGEQKIGQVSHLHAPVDV